MWTTFKSYALPTSFKDKESSLTTVFTSNDVKNLKLSSLSAEGRIARRKLVLAITENDFCFHELQKEIRKRGMYTNLAVSYLLREDTSLIKHMAKQVQTRGVTVSKEKQMQYIDFAIVSPGSKKFSSSGNLLLNKIRGIVQSNYSIPNGYFDFNPKSNHHVSEGESLRHKNISLGVSAEAGDMQSQNSYSRKKLKKSDSIKNRVRNATKRDRKSRRQLNKDRSSRSAQRAHKPLDLEDTLRKANEIIKDGSYPFVRTEKSASFKEQSKVSLSEASINQVARSLVKNRSVTIPNPDLFSCDETMKLLNERLNSLSFEKDSEKDSDSINSMLPTIAVSIPTSQSQAQNPRDGNKSSSLDNSSRTISEVLQYDLNSETQQGDSMHNLMQEDRSDLTVKQKNQSQKNTATEDAQFQSQESGGDENGISKDSDGQSLQEYAFSSSHDYDFHSKVEPQQVGCTPPSVEKSESHRRIPVEEELSKMILTPPNPQGQNAKSSCDIDYASIAGHDQITHLLGKLEHAELQKAPARDQITLHPNPSSHCKILQTNSLPRCLDSGMTQEHIPYTRVTESARDYLGSEVADDMKINQIQHFQSQISKNNPSDLSGETVFESYAESTLNTSSTELKEFDQQQICPANNDGCGTTIKNPASDIPKVITKEHSGYFSHDLGLGPKTDHKQTKNYLETIGHGESHYILRDDDDAYLGKRSRRKTSWTTKYISPSNPATRFRTFEDAQVDMLEKVFRKKVKTKKPA